MGIILHFLVVRGVGKERVIMEVFIINVLLRGLGVVA